MVNAVNLNIAYNIYHHNTNFFFFEVFCPFYFQKSEKWTFSKCPKTDFPNLEWAKNFKKKNLDDNALKPISKKFSL